jgi:hypothetical protein
VGPPREIEEDDGNAAQWREGDEADAGGNRGEGACGSSRAGVILHSESRRALNFSKAIAPLQAGEKSTAPLFVGER